MKISCISETLNSGLYIRGRVQDRKLCGRISYTRLEHFVPNVLAWFEVFSFSLRNILKEIILFDRSRDKE